MVCQPDVIDVKGQSMVMTQPGCVDESMCVVLEMESVRMDHCFAEKICGEKPINRVDTSHTVNANEYPVDLELHHQVSTNGSDRLSDLNSST